MLYRIIFLSGSRTGEHTTVTEEPMIFGRDEDCTVVIPDPEVARKHATLVQKDEEVFIRDLGSMNRILVNKHEVREARLKHGDEIELGRTRLVLQALVQAEVAGNATSHRRRHRAAWAVATLLLIGTILALSARYVPRSTDEDVAVAPPAVTSPPLTVARERPPASASNVNEDLRGLRDDILAIQASVKTLAAQPPPPAPAIGDGLPAIPAPKSPRTPRQEAEELIGSAREAVASRHFDEADQLLAHIQRIDPDYLPAYEARAQLFEVRGQNGEAAAQWSEVLHHSTESPLYQKAVAERIRLSQAAAPAPAAGKPVLKIANVQQNRFQGSDDYDEMRMLNISLAPTETGQRIDRDAVHVEVTFFDRDISFGDVRPTEGRVVQEVQPPTAAWGRDSEKVVLATYMIPKGLRAKQEVNGRPAAYHGYRVRVFYHDELQDETAMPTTLLTRVEGAAPGPAAQAPSEGAAKNLAAP